ncbi:Platinum sensitivity protein [Linnemannia exigua]|uniref:Platinum sensitivity protein n=1 Tax=Linnemannia exigua TaxID=604196 RepID=A0AAD4H9I4_9FUNG|nr:Platinum sensitivity protein [Linnemannia exigua]
MDETDIVNGKADYRRTFAHHSKLKQIIPIDNPYTLRMIHQVNRLQFLKEIILSENLNLGKETAGILRSMIKSKTPEIVQDIGYDQNVVDSLCYAMINEAEPMHRRQDVVFYVHQLCTMAKTLKMNIYKKLSPFYFTRLLNFAVRSSDTQVKQACIEILQVASDTNPNFIRSHIARCLSTNCFKGFFDTITNHSLTGSDASIMPQFKSPSVCLA